MLSSARADEASAPSAPVLGYRLIASYPHDPTAFTQGLIHAKGRLYEGTGNYGASVLRRVDLTSGRVERETRLPSRLFGEGITLWRGRLVQLTWRERLGLIYDPETLKPLETFRYQGEGWGLTHDERHWIMSDGSAVLRFLDPDSQEVVRRLTVLDGARPIDRLNELEYINGEIWANVWKRDHLVRISPETGAVLAYVDLAGLYPAAERPSQEAVLNGIAHDVASGRLFVTGKYWPRLYEIEVLQKSAP